MGRTSGFPAEERILKCLSEFEPLPYKAIAEMLSIKEKAAFETVRRMWDRKLVYVRHYERNRAAQPIPHYAIGSAEDAEKPPKVTGRENNLRWIARLKAQMPERWQQMKQSDVKKRQAKLNSDLELKAKVAAYKLEWSRKKFGHQPRSLSAPKQLDEIAMQFGITWRFEKTRRKAA